MGKFWVLNLLWFCVFNICSSDLLSQIKNEDELKKQANSYFEEEDYGNAYKFYSQLVSLYPKDPDYNYRIGVCMLYNEPDKKKPFSYFNIAVKNLSEAPKEALFYLAKTYHVNYKFDDAIKYYNEYKKNASSGSIKKLQVDREIQACLNGKKLLSNLSDLVIISKKQLNEADYFRSYDTKDIGGKLLVKPDDFKSGYDKKKKEKSIVYLPKTGERVYYSSYGESGDRGRDIYFVNRLPNGSWSKPQSLPANVNSEFDEDYPFLHPNGQTLYFSSKGHNGMGGYDVFKTTFNPETNSWSVPVNLEFPINSPDDDILFVTDSLEKNAFFSTGRYSPYGKIDVLKINTERRPMNYAIIKGTVLKDESAQSLKSKITVKNIENGEIIGAYQANDNGDYYMEILNGGKFLFTVETPGLPVQSDAVQIPVAYSLKPYKQAITYDNKKLTIKNYFDNPVDDENYAMMLDFIEKKAKLEINETEPYNNGLKEALKNQSQNNGNNNINAVTSTNPTITPDVKNNDTPKTNVTNEQLIDIAKDDALEAQKEATQLKQEASDAFGLATQKNAELVEIQKNIENLKNTVNSTSDNSQKSILTNQLNQLNEDAKSTQNIVTIATNMAKKLEVDAQAKQKEADLTSQYIKELEAVTKNKNNKEALAKLEQIQKELDELANLKNQSDDLYASIKAENELKQTELNKSEKKGEDIKNEIQVLNNEIKDLENDLSSETDNSLKENISAQIREIKNEVDIKNKELEINNQKINSLNNELNSLNEELLVAAKLLNENTDNISAVTNSQKDNKYTYIDEPDKNDAVETKTVTDIQNKDNKEINAINNNVAVNSNNNINKVENDGNKNNANNADIASQIDVNKPISNQLTAIKNEIAQNSSDLSNVISISNSSKSNDELKQNYTSKFNELVQQQKLVLDLIEKTQKNPNLDANLGTEFLEKESEQLYDEAMALRKQAGTKTGTEQQNLINQAQQKEKDALEKNIQITNINQRKNSDTYSLNQENIEALQRLSNGKSGNEISQANLLVEEAKLNFDQAKKLREEADSYPNGAAKLGGLTNAEEKENEAIQKQNQALALLSRANPGFKPKIASEISSQSTDINTLNQAIAKSNQLQQETSIALSKSNQNEISSSTSKLSSNQTAEVKQLIDESNALNNEAKQYIGQSITEPSATKKAALLLEANKKEAEAISKLNEANNLTQSTVQKDVVNANNNISNQQPNANRSSNTDVITENQNNDANGQKQNNVNEVTQNNEKSAAVSNAELNTKATKSGVREDIQLLKENVSKPTPIGLLNFNSYSSSDASNINNSAVEKLNSALNTDKTLLASIDKLLDEATKSPVSGNLTQNDIEELKDDAEKLLKQSLLLRRDATNKIGADKEKDIQQAQDMESRALAKKMDSADKQKLLNNATYIANAESLKELEAMAQGKNIAELKDVSQKINEIEKDIIQANSMRLEANSYPTDAAKIGGYSNAEEKENEAIAKQIELLQVYRKYFSNFVPKQAQVSNEKPDILTKYNDLEKLADSNYQNHVDGLTLKAQANEKEYKTRYLSLPENLSDPQQNAKSAAQNNYKKFQELNNQLATTTNLKEKKRLLIEANNYAQQAINSLNEVTSITSANVDKTPASSNINANVNNVNQINNQNNTNRTQNQNNNINSTNNENIDITNTTKNQNIVAINTNRTNIANTNVVKINVQGVEVKNSNAYTASNPIPIDPKLPEGLVFKVQIGAFKAPLPDNTFKGLSPIIAQTTPSGYVRYMAGNFDKFENANAVKNDLRALGYSDAFVVGYFNGQRISISEALAKLKDNGQIVEVAANTSAGLLENANIPRNPFPVNQNTVISASQNVIIANELEKINGLLYTVQIGVFSKQITKAQLFNLGPIYTEQLPSGLYRYTAGIYNQTEKLLEDKRKVVDLGVKDAFVSAYYNSKRIPFAEAKRLQTENTSVKLEVQNPIIFPSVVNSQQLPANTNATNISVTNSAPANNAFSNGVSSGPTPTSENGVKYDEAGITFKVQIGAYKNQVPNDAASKFLSIKTWPVSNVVINGLYIYTIGSFSGLNFAKKLKDEALLIGISDAFITVYKDGKKLYGAEAAKYLGQ